METDATGGSILAISFQYTLQTTRGTCWDITLHRLSSVLHLPHHNTGVANFAEAGLNLGTAGTKSQREREAGVHQDVQAMLSITLLHTSFHTILPLHTEVPFGQPHDP
jgi:hypothetical protein